MNDLLIILSCCAAGIAWCEVCKMRLENTRREEAGLVIHKIKRWIYECECGWTGPAKELVDDYCPACASFESFLGEVAKGCNCCPDCHGFPCVGCCSSGICDSLECTCFYDYEEEESIMENE